MPHLRPRHLNSMIKKSLRFWPTLCLVGSRQVGKSTFLKQMKEYRYLSFDDQGLAKLATQNPDQILTSPCILDEAQKVPSVFDAVKLRIDEQRKPGQFILTGSVRFSRRTLIRESLAGRSKTIQMFPLTCSETLSYDFEDRWDAKSLPKPRVTRKEFQRHLSKGGMPAVFAARNSKEVAAFWSSLLDSYLYRDLLLAIPKNAKPAVAQSALRAICEIFSLGEVPTFSRILKKTGGTRGVLERHLQGLEDLMILHRIPHWKASRTKDIFVPFDPALFLTVLRIESASHDAAIYATCMYISLLNECLAHAQVSDRAQDVHYAVSPTGEMIHLILSSSKNRIKFWKIMTEATPHDYQLRFLKVLKVAEPGSQARVLSSTSQPFEQSGIQVAPWESVL